MKILLDTSTFLWIITDSPELSKKAKAVYLDEENEVFLSTISAWEIAIKYKLKKLPLPSSPDKYIPYQREQHQINSLALTDEATFFLPKLPDFHKDPFDRMLICQALADNMTLLSSDENIIKYPVQVIWD